MKWRIFPWEINIASLNYRAIFGTEKNLLSTVSEKVPPGGAHGIL